MPDEVTLEELVARAKVKLSNFKQKNQQLSETNKRFGEDIREMARDDWVQLKILNDQEAQAAARQEANERAGIMALQEAMERERRVDKLARHRAWFARKEHEAEERRMGIQGGRGGDYGGGGFGGGVRRKGHSAAARPFEPRPDWNSSTVLQPKRNRRPVIVTKRLPQPDDLEQLTAAIRSAQSEDPLSPSHLSPLRSPTRSPVRGAPFHPVSFSATAD